jgi:hypothetical protein
LDIEFLPLRSWIECCKGNLSKIRIDDENVSIEKDVKAWNICFNTYISRVGFPELFQDYLENLQKLSVLQCEFMLDRDRLKLNEINYLKAQVKEFEKQNDESKDESSIMKNLNTLSKSQGYTVRVEDITTLQYFEMVKELTKPKAQNNG